ncbi:MAG: ribosome recycling factor [Firmicutes bacterium]|uniref:Ribosome-recycling factor n=1 Tax=Candidatus Onthovivens merdipullorum TaxID=2840889 RepID=A0A9D9DNF9_9BACL|nr:ribosome recycling factor [Candidatus Onthovivens merdipullorum]
MDKYAENAKIEMQKCCDNLKESLSTLRTGRASPALLNNIECDYYGDKMRIVEISAIKVPEPRQLLIEPYDRNDVKSIVAAINKSDIGINPVVDGNKIRLTIPPLTEDRRKELVKKSKGYCEDYKVSVRNLRRETMDKLKKDDTYTEDMEKRAENDIQKVTDEAISNIDKIYKEKESEIMAI